MTLEACEGYLLGSRASRGMGKGSADALVEEQNPNHPCSSDVKTIANIIEGRVEDFGYFLLQTWIIQGSSSTVSLPLWAGHIVCRFA